MGQDIINDLQQIPEGPFRAIRKLLGVDQAKKLPRQGELHLPECYINEHSQKPQTSI
jgi:hypothetical protein